MKQAVRIIWFFLVLSVTNCVEKFDPPISASATNLLVVDGFLNSTANIAQIKLFKSNTLSSSKNFQTETLATVSIETDDGVKYNLLEKKAGVYELTGTAFPLQKNYRLRIFRKNGKTYLSDFVQLTPPVSLDGIGWTAEEDGVTVYGDAHDALGKTRYYKWNYAETWEYNSTYESLFKLVNGVPIYRTPDEYIYKCWKTETGPAILVNTTSQLGADIVYHFPLTLLPVGTIKLTRTYSILVSLRGVSESEYEYWYQLRKTTENLGSLFDPLPSQVTGNMHSESDPDEPVLGYFGGGAVQEQRLFIKKTDLPERLWKGPSVNCPMDSIPIAGLKSYGSSILLITSYGPISPIGYLTAPDNCIDCRLAGGTTTKPDFWP